MGITMLKKRIIIFLLLGCLLGNNLTVFAIDTKYPNYANEFLGEDKHEKFNRRMFNFNQKLNKYAIRPIHILWSSIMPEFGMDRLNGISNNIEYPIRLTSSLIQRDFKTSKNETLRFLTNTLLGLGGMFDPARHIFKIEQAKENMEQALEKCHIKSGPYFVAPIISFTSVRGIFGRILDIALNPSSYIGTPIIAAAKALLTINRTSYAQPLLKMVESNYCDPYEIMKKAYGIDCYIKQSNLDRVDVKKSLITEPIEEIEGVQDVISQKTDTTEIAEKPVKIEVSSELLNPNHLYGEAIYDEDLKGNETLKHFKLNPDIKLKGYHPQHPVVDSMRTALFFAPGVDDSIWNELSLWNRCFNKKIRQTSIHLTDEKDDYKFRFILQKDKKSPLAIIYPSIGEGIMSHHSATLGKILYDKGYSVIIQGSHFQWEFVKSMPENYRPGDISKDADIVRKVSAKIINQLEEKYNYKFGNKIIVGTSLGALTALYIGEKESKDNTLGNLKIISICPPIDLVYAMKQIDKNSEDWAKSPENLKEKVGLTAAKVVNLYQYKDKIDFEVNNLPFNEEEGKLITGFVMHQKLSDLIYTIEHAEKIKDSRIYNDINNMGYQDYVNKYLIEGSDDTMSTLSKKVNLAYISDYLENENNYKIYHSINDYLTNNTQLKNLKKMTGNKTVLLDNGAHLGFLYRHEFIEDLKKSISDN